MKIEAITVKNFKVFENTEFKHLGKMCVLVGKNGSGKTTFFDIFRFLKDSLQGNVNTALNKRGGFKEVVSRNSKNSIISFEIKFREPTGRLATYILEISLSEGKAIVSREILKFRRGSRGKPWHFLDFSEGQGDAITNEDDYNGKKNIDIQREHQKLESPDILAIKGLGQFSKFKVVSAFRKMIEMWHVSDFHINAAQTLQDDAYAEHLSEYGDNLPQVAKYIYENHPLIFTEILEKMSLRVPGISQVEAKPMEDGRIVLKFKDGSFKDPFIARYVSDGTIKMFAYLILLHDPTPHKLLCIEEPENQLYPHLMKELSEEFRIYAARGGQIFVTTHSPDFLNGVKLKEIYWLEKENGFSKASKASDYPLLTSLIKAGDKPGMLWKQDLFKGEY